jgi:hypothetical protein
LQGPIGLGAKLGGGWGVSSYTDLGGTKHGASGVITGGSIGAIASAGPGSIGISKEKGVKIITPRDDDKPTRYKDIDDTVRGWKIKKADASLKGDPYNPWKIGAEATVIGVQAGASVDFKKVCDGIMGK